MTLFELKTTYQNANNVNMVELINTIENIANRTNISVNKIIAYLKAITTLKINKKNLNILEHSFPFSGTLTHYEYNLITNKNLNDVDESPEEIIKEYNKKQQETEQIKKHKKTKPKNEVNNDINIEQEN